MIGLLSKVNIIDNSGGQIGRCIKVLKPGKKPLAKIGDVIIISVLKISNVQGGVGIQKGDLFKALVVRTIKENKTRWSSNAVILIKDLDLQPIGTRIKGPISSYINNLKIMTLTKTFF